MNAQRWFSGDSHVHFLGAQGAHREAQGEDLNVVNLLQSQWGHLFTNTEDALGLTTTNRGQTIVYCSQENRQHMLGHLTLWGLKEPVMPWCTDGPDEAELGGALEETMAYWADACHAQGGTVIIPHLPNPNCEPAVLIATDRADAVEMIVHRELRTPRILSLPELRVSPAARRRHRQNVQQRAGRVVSHLCLCPRRPRSSPTRTGARRYAPGAPS